MPSINDDQRVAVNESGHVLVRAFPGSGKTRTLVARAARKVEEMPQYRMLAMITYTNAAANEISDRLSFSKGAFVGTIHRFCLEFILRPFGWLYNWKRPKLLSIDHKIEIVELYKDRYQFHGRLSTEDLEKVRKDFEGNLIRDADFRDPLIVLEDLAQVYYQYLSDKQIIDFDGILSRSLKILKEHAFVCKAVAAKFFEIMVDEFQDTNLFQYEILKLIENKGMTTLFLVGDPNQSIMGFAGAVPNVFERASLDFGITAIPLKKTYRSSQHIVSAYTSLISNHLPVDNSDSENDELDSKLLIREVNYDRYATDGVQFSTNLIGRVLSRFQNNGIMASKIAVLSPWFSDCMGVSGTLRNDFIFSGLGALPHRTRDIRDSSFELLRATARFYLKPTFKNLRTFRITFANRIAEGALDEDWNTYTNQNCFLSEVFDINESIEVIEGLSQIAQIMNGMFQVNHPTISEIQNRIQVNNASNWSIKRYFQVLSGEHGISNITLHSSKGLEYDAVILNRIDNGRVPFSRRDEEPTDANIEDGTKLLYVGISRAKKFLCILHGNDKSFLLDAIPPDCHSG